MIEIFTKSDGPDNVVNKRRARTARARKVEKEKAEKDISSLAGFIYPDWARPGSKLVAPNKQPKPLR